MLIGVEILYTLEQKTTPDPQWINNHKKYTVKPSDPAMPLMGPEAGNPLLNDFL
jgi:hypothetical protein